MKTRFVGYSLCCLVTVLVVTTSVGCAEDAMAASTHELTKPVQEDAAVHAELVKKLAKADRLDGEADKVVTRCASCSLSMDGKREHALKVLDYTMYFCREACAQSFAKNLTQSVQEMKIPEGAPAKKPKPKQDKGETALQKKMLSKLAKADKLDGKADKIVVRCAMCALNMDGTKEHTVKAMGYTLYFCREGCAKRFSEDVTKSILGLNVPDDPPDVDSKEAKKRAKIREKIMAQLAAADALDGEVDKTVVRCPSCALSMDGIAEHALKSHGYTIYFCRAGCAERFGKDIPASILAMEIPEE